MSSTVDDARGRWPEIFGRLGLPDGTWRKKKGPCPICGGRDRYRWTDKDDDGWGFCQQCGGMSGLLLVRKFKSWSHKEACDAIDGILGNSNGQAYSRSSEVQSAADKQRSLERLIADAVQPAIVEHWLRLRGLSVSSPVLRGHPACAFRDENGQFIGRFPAVVAPILSPDGTIVSAQRLYLSDRIPAKQRKKEMPSCGPRNGAAIRLVNATQQLGVAEGVATALAAFEIFDVPTWACLDAHNLTRFSPPNGITHITVFADHDRNFTGQAAAYALAERLAKTTALKVAVMLPDEPGADWNDMLAGRAP
jgi:putative DNA primase/helicase